MNAAQREALVEAAEETLSDLELEVSQMGDALAAARRLLGRLKQQLSDLADLDLEDSELEDEDSE